MPFSLSTSTAWPFEGKRPARGSGSFPHRSHHRVGGSPRLPLHGGGPLNRIALLSCAFGMLMLMRLRPTDGTLLPEPDQALPPAHSGQDEDVQTVTWSMPAVAENVAIARQTTADFAVAHGVPDECVGDVRLAVTEAVAKAVLHAFRHRAVPGTVTISVEIPPEDGRIDVVVCDDGSGMARRADSPGMGAGLPIIERLAHRVHQGRSDGGGTVLWMTFRYG